MTRKPVILLDDVASPLEPTCMLEGSGTIFYMGQATDCVHLYFSCVRVCPIKILGETLRESEQLQGNNCNK